MRALILIPLFALIVGCISAPDRANYKHAACFDAAYCRYLAAKSKTALDCSKAADACEKVRTLSTCDEAGRKIEGLTFQSCWDKLR